jgi:hypothetical protein
MPASEDRPKVEGLILIAVHPGMEHLMNLSTVTRLGSAAVVTGIATLALASPASAVVADPQGGDLGSGSSSITVDAGTNWTAVTAGTAGGLAVVGAGVATALTVRRHRALPHAA